MASKHINYLNRDFDSIKEELINYSQENYPQLSDNFGNDSSISSWIIDLLSDCVDSLNYHIDRTFQDTQLDSANSRSSLLNMARLNGLKIPGPKAGTVEVKFSCLLPAGYTTSDGNTDISQPNWNYAPLIQRNCVVAAGSLSYTIDENVDFSQQFNKYAYSNRSYSPKRNSNGDITGYTVTKTVLATAGTRKVYKKILSSNDVEPFMEILLPDKDVMNIESIIFKASSNINVSPEISEYYVDEEEYQFKDSAITTYRFFETDSFVDQWRWGTYMSNMDNEIIEDKFNPEAYVDYTESGGTSSQRITRIYKGQWKPLRQKFITEYTDNGYMKIIFGPGVDYQEFEKGITNYSQYRMANIINNDMLGVLPKIGWTMYVLYNVGGGIETNVTKGAIKTIQTMQVDFPKATDSGFTSTIQSQILRSMSVINTSDGLTGKDAPSTNEIKYYIKYNTGAQDRCVTVKDYQLRLMQMPPKYGAPFRCSAMEENNKIVLSLLELGPDGTLRNSIPNTLVENIESYLSHYKNLCDYIEIKSGKIYNVGFLIDLFIDKSYNSADVQSSVVSTVQDYMDVNNHDMGEDIFLGDLNKEISALDGVVGLIALSVYKISGGSYSSDKCPLPSVDDTNTSNCNTTTNTAYNIGGGAISEKIDLDNLDSVLVGDNLAMYEIKNPNYDIQLRVKLV
jgi:hypothetical protein